MPDPKVFSKFQNLKFIKNKNWVTVRDKCPQINVQFKWHTFLKNENEKVYLDILHEDIS